MKFPLEYNYKDKDAHIKYLLLERFEIELSEDNDAEANLVFSNFIWLYPYDKKLYRKFLSRYASKLNRLAGNFYLIKCVDNKIIALTRSEIRSYYLKRTGLNLLFRRVDIEEGYPHLIKIAKEHPAILELMKIPTYIIQTPYPQYSMIEVDLSDLLKIAKEYPDIIKFIKKHYNTFKNTKGHYPSENIVSGKNAELSIHKEKKKNK